MGKSSEQAIYEMEKQLVEEVSLAQVKEYRKSERSKNIEPLNVDGKILLTRGICEKITEVSSKFGGHNYRLSVSGSNFYFNCKAEGGVFKLFEINKPCCFVAIKKGNYNVVSQVFYCG